MAYYRPPLALELFEDRTNFNEILTRYPQCHGRVAELRSMRAHRQGFNVEHEVESIKRSGETYPPTRVELAAIQFYLRDALTECGTRWQAIAHGLTNYAHLLARIDRWRHKNEQQVVLVTFNYDRLLEMTAEASTIRLDFNDIAAYIKRDDYKVIKPHGSVDWAQLLDNNAPGADPEKFMIENVASLNFTNQYRVTMQTTMGGKLVYPAIAIPVEGKSDFACPADHITKLVASLDQVTHILIVGWRASERHFLDNLRDRLDDKQIHIVAGSQAEAEQIKQTLLTTTRVRHPDFVTCSPAPGFSSFLIQADELEVFLSR